MEVKKIKVIKLGTVFFVALFTLSIISGTFAANSSTQSTININVKVNQQFSLKLISNPSTGYQWEPFYDSKYLSLEDSLFLSNNLNRAGVPGTQIFKFKAIRPGETNIVVKYQRSWEKKPVKVVIYHITITK